ncbi:bifunctional riboflavin kinase/FAD synthetase [Clostridium sp. MSJ-8]|uniref:bifunctional riboflavin kinase/FAD synthetase n=1 Tax=Clostridium sp. MSJ-8 TaxID=2841510 RepID=UPI001C0E9645|nr:bifunctional riboflavin kinase/FAD synthetase [Clostridium sp. MSJ-8]MBU5488688.1 bifunctional riboflavin kinase/FAD synthetase [Clostridium sp. MSJ-8]
MIKEGSYVALGSFDGIHMGHMSLINKTVELARNNNAKSVVYTFKNHPREVINKDASIELLMDNEEKYNVLKENNIDIIKFQEFDMDFMQKSSEEFVRDLVEEFNVKGIVVGFNYRFGYKNSGDVKLLEALSKKYNYTLYVMPAFTYNNLVVSSTEIRNVIKEGNIEKANIMLGRAYMLHGIVERGKQIGRTIGFPTANLKYNNKKILPKEGVYYTEVKVNNNLYKAITNIGNNPTVNGSKLTVESYLLDFDEDIYDKEIQVYFLKYIRGVHKFNSLDELKNQLEKDKNFAYNQKKYI